MTPGPEVALEHVQAGFIIIGGQSRRAAAAVQAITPDSSPEDQGGFVGRDRELGELIGLLDPAGGNDTAGMVSAIVGAPGVGKTALVRRAGQVAAGRGWFGGGAVSVDLHGYDPDSLDQVWPPQLYPGLLRRLGVPAEQIPPSEGEQATAYQQLMTQLAEAGQPVLMVLDNVGDSAQVAELLPPVVGGGGHRVLITSRDSLADLADARVLSLDVLDPPEAIELLAAGLRRHGRQDERIAADLEPAARLVELCGYLPLAVEIVAALLADEPDRPLRALADDLADEGGRLHALAYNERWAVRAAFDLSHRKLPHELQRLFRMIAAVPGPDVGLETLAAALGQPAGLVRTGLMRLARAHLLEHLPGGGRWQMHDLIRLYAGEQLRAGERDEAFDRVLAWYRVSVRAAWARIDSSYAGQPPGPAEIDRFSVRGQVGEWVRQERAGLVATVLGAAASHPTEMIDLSLTLGPLCGWAAFSQDWVTVAAAAVETAQYLPDRQYDASTLDNLGSALKAARQYEEALDAHVRALMILRELGDRHSEGTAWNHLGHALAAIGFHEQELALAQVLTGDPPEEGAAWTHPENAPVDMSRLQDAAEAHEAALAIFRELGDRYSEARTLCYFGPILRGLDHRDDARIVETAARDLFTEIGAAEDAEYVQLRMDTLYAADATRRTEGLRLLLGLRRE